MPHVVDEIVELIDQFTQLVAGIQSQEYIVVAVRCLPECLRHVPNWVEDASGQVPGEGKAEQQRENQGHGNQQSSALAEALSSGPFIFDVFPSTVVDDLSLG